MKPLSLTFGLLCLFISLLSGQGLTIEDGSHLVVSGDAAIVVNDGSFINDGTYNSGGGSLYMKGSAPTTNSKIKASNVSNFNHVVIDKTANGVQLENSISVYGNMDMQSGTLDLNGNTLSLYFDGIILNETEDNRIWGDSGTIFKADLLNQPTNADIGNLGLQISSGQNLNVVYVRRHHGSQLINGTPSATRRYEVEYFVSGLTMDYNMKYFDAELNGIDEAYLQSWRYANGWQQRNADAIDTMANLVQITGASEVDTLWAFAPGKLELAAKVLLEGNYASGGLMTDNLRSKGLIPVTEPYTGLGYAHVGSGGETIDPAVLTVTGDNAIVDWLFLEVRNNTDSTTVAQTMVGLLQKDGDIVGLDGVSPLQIPNLSVGDYYLAIRHRNHLAIRSANKLALSPTVNNYDFSSSLSQAWDKTSVSSNDAMVDNGGVFLLHRCDNNGDGFINILDFILSKSNSTPNQSNVYLTYDINLDGNTNILDFILSKSESSPNKSAHID